MVWWMIYFARTRAQTVQQTKRQSESNVDQEQALQQAQVQKGFAFYGMYSLIPTIYYFHSFDWTTNKIDGQHTGQSKVLCRSIGKQLKTIKRRHNGSPKAAKWYDNSVKRIGSWGHFRPERIIQHRLCKASVRRHQVRKQKKECRLQLFIYSLYTNSRWLRNTKIVLFRPHRS